MFTSPEKKIKIFIGEDDPEDIELLLQAFENYRKIDSISVFVDGEDLLNNLDLTINERLPDLILLDLNMPKKTGLEVLKSLKENLQLKNIPVIVYSTSKSEADVTASYEYGAKSYFIKPNSFKGIKKVIDIIDHFWVEMEIDSVKHGDVSRIR